MQTSTRFSASKEDRAMVLKQADQIVESAREARQAEEGPTVRNVLLASTCLAMVALVIVWFVFFRM